MVPSWLSALEVSPGDQACSVVIKEAPTPELLLTGKNHTVASCLHWLFIYDSMFKGQNSHKQNCLCGREGHCPLETPPPHPSQHCKQRLEDYAPSLPTCGSRPSKDSCSWGLLPRLPSRLPGASLAVTWCLPSRQDSSILCSPPPPFVWPTFGDLHQGNLYQPSLQQLLRKPGARAPSRLRHTRSALLK